MKQMSKEMDDVAKTIETFIRRYYDLEVIISTDATKLVTKSNLMFSDLIGNIVSEYVIEKTNAKADKRVINAQIMANCFALITKAYGHGFVSQGTDLLEKLDDCRKRNVDLIKDLATCTANYTVLERKYNRLYNMLDQNQSKKLEEQEEENE